MRRIGAIFLLSTLLLLLAVSASEGRGGRGGIHHGRHRGHSSHVIVGVGPWWWGPPYPYWYYPPAYYGPPPVVLRRAAGLHRTAAGRSAWHGHVLVLLPKRARLLSAGAEPPRTVDSSPADDELTRRVCSGAGL